MIKWIMVMNSMMMKRGGIRRRRMAFTRQRRKWRHRKEKREVKRKTRKREKKMKRKKRAPPKR